MYITHSERYERATSEPNHVIFQRGEPSWLMTRPARLVANPETVTVNLKRKEIKLFSNILIEEILIEIIK